jgi:hypothetical protein
MLFVFHSNNLLLFYSVVLLAIHFIPYFFINCDGNESLVPEL